MSSKTVHLSHCAGEFSDMPSLLHSPLLSDIPNNLLLQSNFSVSVWNTNGLKNNNHNPNKLENIASAIELFNSQLVLLTETHLEFKNNNLSKHPISRLRSVYPYFCNNSIASNKGGVSVISKIPLTIHCIHSSGNLIHFSISDVNDNHLPFILCYASPTQRRYYWNIIIERFNIIPDSIIAGDLNTDIVNDNYFKNSLLKPLCLSPDQEPSNAIISFIPRGNGSPRRLDWLLLPCSFYSHYDTSSTLLPQTTIPISDHLLLEITLSPRSRSENNSKFKISANLFEKEEVKKALRRSSKRLSSESQDSFYVVESYLSQAHEYLSILTKIQSRQNNKDINEAKRLSETDSITPDIKKRITEILRNRTISSRDRFRHFIANSRHSPSKAMTIMQKQKSVSKTITVESLPKHSEFWSKLYAKKSGESDTISSSDHFFKYISSSGSPLSYTAQQHLKHEINVDELSSTISSAPNRSAAGLEISYEFYKLAHPSFLDHLTVVLNRFYSDPESLPDWIGMSSISLLHKKGPTDNPANYRPISLLPT